MYLIVYRENQSSAWLPWAVFCEEIEEAQQKMIEMSRVSELQYSIMKVTSVLAGGGYRLMEYKLKDDATFKQTWGGESYIDGWKTDDYGFRIGDLTVHNLKGDEFAKFVCHAIDHLRLNGHVFIRERGQYTKTRRVD